MNKKSIQISSIAFLVALSVFLLIMSHSSLVNAEGVRGHGNVDDVIVTIDGDPVTRGDILGRIRIAKGDIDPSKMEPDKWQEIIQTATKSEIIDKLFLKAAHSENMKIDPEKLETFIQQSKERHGLDQFKTILGIQNTATKQELKEAVKEKMLIEDYKTKLVKNISVKNEEVKEYYEENKDTFSMPDRAHLELLIMDKSVDADALFKRVKKGEDFEKVAREAGKNESASIERLRRWTDYSKMSVEIQPKLKEGKTSDILKPFLISDKYYIMKILEKRPAGSAGFDEVEDRIRETLKRKKETTTILSWYEARVRDHKIEYVKKE